MSKIKKISEGKEYVGALEYEDVSTKLQRLFSRIRKANFLAKKSHLDMRRYGVARYTQPGTYAPTIAASTPFPVSFSATAFTSEDVYIRRHYTQSNAFVAGKTGIYDINVYWSTGLSPASAYTVSIYSLMLYKNGALYATLDSKPMVVPNPTTCNYYFPFMTLQGTVSVPLTNKDYFQICIQHNGGASFDGSVQHTGWFDVKYICKDVCDDNNIITAIR